MADINVEDTDVTQTSPSIPSPFLPSPQLFTNKTMALMNNPNKISGQDNTSINMGDTNVDDTNVTETPMPSPWLPIPQLFSIKTSALMNNQTKKAGQDNTLLAYEPKIKEFQQYCHSVFASEGSSAEIVTADKAFGFLVYNAFREKKKTRGRKKQGSGNVPRFDRLEYNGVRKPMFLTKTVVYTHFIIKYAMF